MLRCNKGPRKASAANRAPCPFQGLLATHPASLPLPPSAPTSSADRGRPQPRQQGQTLCCSTCRLTSHPGAEMVRLGKTSPVSAASHPITTPDHQGQSAHLHSEIHFPLNSGLLSCNLKSSLGGNKSHSSFKLSWQVFPTLRGDYQ